MVQEARYKHVFHRPPGNPSRIAPGFYVKLQETVRAGPFKTAKKAAHVAASLVGCTVSSLVQGSTVNKVCTLQFICQRTIVSGGTDYTYWCAKPPQKRQRLFAQLERAEEYVLKETGLSRCVLAKAKRSPRASELARRVCVFAKVYNKCKELPGDVVSLKEHAQRSARHFKREPAAMVLLVQAKYGPFRDAMMAAFRSKDYCRFTVHNCSKVQGCRLRAEMLLQVLCKAVRQSSGQNFTAWVANCGRNVSHHSGFIPMLRRFNVLRTARRHDVEKFTFHGPTQYALCASAGGSRKAIRKLESLITFADAAAEVMFKVQGPGTCRAWCSLYTQLLEAVGQHPSPGMSFKHTAVPYLTGWTCRGMLLLRMYQGKAQLRADDTPVSEFARSFPDQKGIVAKLQGHWRSRNQAGADTVRALCQRTLAAAVHASLASASVVHCLSPGVVNFQRFRSMFGTDFRPQDPRKQCAAGVSHHGTVLHGGAESNAASFNGLA